MPGTLFLDLLGVRDPNRVEASWSSVERCEAIAIASSMGGGAALFELLASLPSDSPPVLLAHHKGWTDPNILVSCLRRASRLPVRIASNGEAVLDGTVYVPGAGCHLLVSSERSLSTPEWGRIRHVCPSADLLFASMARVYGNRAAAVVLSGLGSDGAEGARAVRRNGGYVIVQSEASARHFEMPRAAIEAQAADVVLPVAEIGPALRLLSSG